MVRLNVTMFRDDVLEVRVADPFMPAQRRPSTGAMCRPGSSWYIAVWDKLRPACWCKYDVALR